ncbi:MAG: hypothetical protein AAF725_04275 [Acidobacteriota bacterium]
MISQALAPHSPPANDTRSQCKALAAPAHQASDPEILPVESPRERFDRLRAEARRAIQSGQLESCLALLDEALAIARDLGDPRLEATAVCNRAAIGISIGETEDHVAPLRTILMRNFGLDTSFAAAYNLAQAYEAQKQYKKSLFYARVARDRALAAENQEFLAKSLTQLGLSLLGESFFDQAAGSFKKSISLMGPGLNELSVSPRLSHGYCLVVLGRAREAMGEFYRCLRWMRRSGQQIYRPWAHLFLGCGHLELGRLRHAWLHVRRSLQLAEEMGEDEATKSALMMLGEVERAAGDYQAAYDCFQSLQHRFFPDDDSDYAEVLSMVGVARVVNLGI